MGHKEALTESQREGLQKIGAGLWADVHEPTCKALERRGLCELVARPHGAFSDLRLTDKGQEALATLKATS